MADTMKALQTVTVGAGGASSISFTNIPQTYTDLVLKISARGTFAAVYNTMLPTFFGSTAYQNSVLFFGSGSSAVSAPRNPANPSATGSTATASVFSNGELYVQNYTSSSVKSFSIDNAQESNGTESYIELYAGVLSSTDPITSLGVSTAAGTFVEHSTFTLYGVYAQADRPNTPSISSVSDFGGGTAQVAIASPLPISYEVTSSPGSFVGVGQSPVSVPGLSPATAYTFTAKALSPMGNSVASAASSSATLHKGFVALATAVTDGTTQGVTFSSIPQDYTHLQIRCFVRNGASAPNPDYTLMQINGDTAANYINHGFYTNGSSVTSDMFNNSTYGFCGPFSYNSGAYSTANMWTSIVIDLLDYTNTNKFKAIRSIGGYDANGSGFVGIYSGMWRNTAALTSIKISAANAAEVGNSVYTLYGIK